MFPGDVIDNHTLPLVYSIFARLKSSPRFNGINSAVRAIDKYRTGARVGLHFKTIVLGKNTHETKLKNLASCVCFRIFE